MISPIRYSVLTSRFIKAVAIAALMLWGLFLLIRSIIGQPRIMSRVEAEHVAHSVLEMYSDENKLDIRRFAAPEVIRGRLAHAELDKQGHVYEVYGKTWDFYYTYQDKPRITVFIAYDEKSGYTECLDVYQPGEKWPARNQ